MFDSDISLKNAIAAKEKSLILQKGVKPDLGDKSINYLQMIVNHFHYVFVSVL